jgi:hypothetical protein
MKTDGREINGIEDEFGIDRSEFDADEDPDPLADGGD